VFGVGRSDRRRRDDVHPDHATYLLSGARLEWLEVCVIALKKIADVRGNWKTISLTRPTPT
jgi:hypothetical protein